MSDSVFLLIRYADEGLEFNKDLFETDEPALWQKDLTGLLEKWIEVGCPSEDKIKKASARCKQVAIVTYGSQANDWWQKNTKIKTLSNVEVWQLTPETTEALEQLCERTMQLQLNIMDGEWTLLSDKGQLIYSGKSYSNTLRLVGERNECRTRNY